MTKGFWPLLLAIFIYLPIKSFWNLWTYILVIVIVLHCVKEASKKILNKKWSSKVQEK